MIRYDQSGNNNNAVPGSGTTSQPSIVDGSTLSAPLLGFALGFLGRTRMLSFTSTAASSAWAVYSSVTCAFGPATTIATGSTDVGLRLTFSPSLTTQDWLSPPSSQAYSNGQWGFSQTSCSGTPWVNLAASGQQVSWNRLGAGPDGFTTARGCDGCAQRVRRVG